MFLDNLATSLLRLCGHKEFSYERAAEECGLSSRYFGNIVRKTSAPTVVTLEKLCNGFQMSPDDLLLPASGFPGELRFRAPMKVTQVRCFFYGPGLTGYPVCPQCGSSLEREYQCYCDRCGQCLDWRDFSKATLIPPET